ncbi:MAG: hypothetical protein IJL12_05805 [Selenomonadaceae bacterium]|nr:hypothetical protein [Selenomonadaceae bacterium]MBQ4404528.1 hypothetical protein [Selenomonadaceae bacterium]MBQ6131837.1 hypothetical protein [Selenomonadaceae bacterium]MBQ7492977.1 hypothetical protein [Selenomonadaceae bacterium]
MTKQMISRILIAILIISNIYLVYRVNSNTMAIASYDAGISQKTGVGKLESFWTKYIGGSKDATSYEDRERAEADSQTVTNILIVLDVVLVGAIYFLNRKPKPKPAPVEDDWRNPRRGRRR